MAAASIEWRVLRVWKPVENLRNFANRFVHIINSQQKHGFIS